MTNTETRLVQLAEEQLDLGRPVDLDEDFNDWGLSSLDSVAFLNTVAREFNLSIRFREFVGVNSLRDLASLLDKRST